MILIDSSAWIATFRKTRPLVLTEAIIDEAATCLPIMAEVLAGFRDEAAFRVAKRSLQALPCLGNPLEAHTFEVAWDLYRLARRRGLTIRSIVDCVIAALALEHDAQVLHVDRDFVQIARISRLQQRPA